MFQVRQSTDELTCPLCSGTFTDEYKATNTIRENYMFYDTLRVMLTNSTFLQSLDCHRCGGAITIKYHDPKLVNDDVVFQVTVVKFEE